MNDNEIIKSAEQCINGGECADCLYDDKRGCRGLTADLVRIFNRQKVEIESLKAHNDSLMVRSADIGKMIKAFAELVKLEFYRQFDELIPSIMADKIDEIAKELTVNYESSKNDKQRKEDEGK